jgi:hypothetical protein
LAVAATAAAAVAAALWVEGPVLPLRSTVAVLDPHQLSEAHTLPVELSADQLPHLASIMVAIV